MLRRTFLLSATAFATAIPLAAGSEPVPELTKADEIAIRGTILAINPAQRTVVVQSAERDTLTFKAIDRVANFAALKPGQLVDVRYYRVTDYLVAKTTPEVTEMAREMVREPARAPGLPGSEMRARLWLLEGVVLSTDRAAMKVDIVDANGSVIRSPWIKTPEGQFELERLRPGDMVTMVFSERSAFRITPVR